MISDSSYSYTRKKTTHPLWKVISLIIVFALLASLSLCIKGSLFGWRPGEKTEKTVDAITRIDGSTIINTSTLAGDITGYGGKVPLKIYVSDSKIDSISPLPNSETPSFFKRLYSEGLMSAWNGHTLEEAATMNVDAVSGATFSSKAVIANVKAGAEYSVNHMPAADISIDSLLREGFSWPLLCALVVALMASIIPLFSKNQTYRFIQQLLNVGVLGFWTGTFIDYTMILNVGANGLTFSLSGITCVILLIVGFIYPLFGRSGHYCAWVCPLGSLQELSGHLLSIKTHTGPNTIKFFNGLRNIIWAILIFTLWLGIGTEWVDNELFTGFIVKSASRIILIVGGVFILLSIFIPRPFCRFLCPTGTLLRKSSDLNN